MSNEAEIIEEVIKVTAKHLAGRHDQKEHGRKTSGIPPVAGDGSKMAIREISDLMIKEKITKDVVAGVVVLSNASMAKHLPNSEAMFSPKAKIIITSGSGSKKEILTRVYHELGHAFDYRFPTLKENYLKYASEESIIFEDMLNISGEYLPEKYANEIFALAFGLTKSNTNVARNIMPKTFEFFTSEKWPLED